MDDERNKQNEKGQKRPREELFAAISDLLPTSNKQLDEASILESSIEYIKQLQEQVKSLEQPQTENVTSNSRALMQNDRVSSEDNSASSSSILSVPLEINAKVSGSEILVKVHTQHNQDDIMPRIYQEMQKLQLTPMSSSVIPFENAIDVTIIAKMENDIFCMTVEDLIKYLELALQ